jgi:L-aminopeptidase/D-esterase-like protein
MLRPGKLNLITDVPGLTLGHATHPVIATGVTTLLCDGAWPAGVDVRGGGPGTRETEALAAENAVARVHAIVLAGGSVFGLGAADGVAAVLSEQGVGLQLQPGVPAVPIVPAAVLYDLSGGSTWGAEPPYRQLGIASVGQAARDFALGSVGAGRGAKAGTGKGGVGSASLVLANGIVVGALVAANPIGSALMPDGRTYWAWPFEIDGEFGATRPGADMPRSDPVPDQSRLGALGRLAPGANTTLGIVAVSAELTPAECKRVAMMAQDGLARAIRPAHTPFDGDTIFAIARGAELGENRLRAIAEIGSAAADCLARAIARAVFHA